MKRLAVVLVLSAMAVACGDQRNATAPPGGAAAPGGLLAAISDGAHSGNPDFFFRPPLVPNPASNANYSPGRFNASLRPVVRVFELPGGGNDGCTFTTSPTYGPFVASVNVGEEQYQLNWNTAQSDLVSGTMYRICVFGSGTGPMLGFLDVEPMPGGMRNARIPEETYLFQDDRTLPIKFRIEQGALSNLSEGLVGTEFTVPAGGGSVTLTNQTRDTALAAVFVPSDALQEDTDQVTIVIAQELPQYDDGQQCLWATGLVQSAWCYQIRTEPPNYEFTKLVRVEICVDPTPVPEGLRDQLLVHKYNEEEGLVQLEWAEPTLIGRDCLGPPQLGDAGLSPRGVVARLGDWVGRLFTPPDLMASVFGTPPKGLGGSGGSFSDFGGAVPGPVPTKLAFTAQPTIANAGVAFSPDVAVTVQDAHGATVTSSAASITLSVGTNPWGGSLSGTKTASAVNGVATFTALSIDRVGDGYTLTATATGLAEATSSPITVAASAPTQIALTTAAAGASSGAAFSTQPVVAVQDATGNTVTSDNSTVVTMAVSAGGTVMGTATRTATNGVVTFSDVGISGTVGTYTLIYSSGVLTVATQTIALTPGAPTQLAIRAGDGQTARTGTNVAIPPSVLVRDAANNPVSGVSVYFTPTAGGGIVTGGRPTTEVDGVAAVTAWTLGSTPGANTLTATSGSLSGSPVTFTATAQLIMVDGVMSPGEWTQVDSYAGTITLPDNSTTTVYIWVTNDATNLYTAVMFDRDISSWGANISVVIDEDNNGAWDGHEDGWTVQYRYPLGGGFVDNFYDNFFSTNVSPPQGQGDAEWAGTNDGGTASATTAGTTVVEVWHPFHNTVDLAHDAQLNVGASFSFRVGVFMPEQNVTKFNDLPSSSNWWTYTVR